MPTTAQTDGEFEVYVMGNPDEVVAARLNAGEPSTLSAMAGKVMVCPEGVGVSVGVDVLVGVCVGVLVGSTLVIA